MLSTNSYAYLAPLGALASIALTALATVIALLASITNYPGGVALRTLHDALGGAPNGKLLLTFPCPRSFC